MNESVMALKKFIFSSSFLRFYSVFIYFLCFSFIGWIVETAYIVIAFRRFAPRGLISYGVPIIPVFGFCGIMLLFYLEPIFKKHPLRLYMVATVLMTLFEYFISFQDEFFSHGRTWNYSYLPFNYQGRIQLYASLEWGILALVSVYVIGPQLKKFVIWLNPLFSATITWILFPYVTICGIYDYIFK